MRAGSEIKVGLITVLAAALLVVFAVYVRGFRPGAATYRVLVAFSNSRGLQPGDPVRMVGVKIGEVDFVEIGPQRKAVATLSINRKYPLYTHYEFRIGTSGLIQERFVEVVPGEYTPEAIALEEGDLVEGAMTPDLADLIASGREVLDNLNRTARLLRGVLSDEEVLGGVKEALQNFSDSAAATARLADSVSALSGELRPEMIATLKQVRGAADDLQATTAVVREQVREGTALEDLAQTARHAREAAAKINEMATDLSTLVDPEVRTELRETISAVHEAAGSLKVFSEELRKAAPAVPTVAREAQHIAEMSSALRERLKPPEITAAFDVLYSGEAERSFSSGSLDFKTREGRFLRLGIDDVGEDSSAHVQLGEQQDRVTLRYGLVRSRLGFGLDYRLPRQATISLDVFDPNDVRADVLADVPLILGRWDFALTAGMRDVGDESLFVAGVRLRR